MLSFGYYAIIVTQFYRQGFLAIYVITNVSSMIIMNVTVMIMIIIVIVITTIVLWVSVAMKGVS